MTTPALVFEGVTHGYGGAPPVLSALDLCVQSGTFGVLGNNGAGKSTLLKLASAMVPPTRGHVRVLGMDTRTHEKARLATAYQPEALSVDGSLTPAEFLRFVAEIRGLPDRDAALKLYTRLGGETAPGTLFRELSYGTRRKVGLASALAAEASLLILDEPDSGLDVASLEIVEALIRERREAGTTVLVSSHDMAFISRTCDRLLVLKDGEICWQGEPDKLVREQQADDLHHAFKSVAGEK